MLRARLAEAGMTVDRGAADLISRHLEAVMSANERMNLTAIRELDSAVLLHVVDSLLCSGDLEQAPAGAFADLGSGSGYPGIPLAIVSGRRAALVESISKKARFLEEVVGMLEVEPRIRVLQMRAEELARREPGLYAAVTARALSSLPALVELAAPLLMDGGVLIAMKGKPEAAEIERGRAAGGVVGMALESLREYQLFVRGDARACIVFRKTSEGSISLPRRDGVAQRRPLA